VQCNFWFIHSVHFNNIELFYVLSARIDPSHLIEVNTHVFDYCIYNNNIHNCLRWNLCSLELRF